MSIRYTETKSATDHRTEIDLDDGRYMTINITHEGIIMDVFQNHPGFDEHLGTVGMTFDEWADDIVANDVVTMIGHT